MTNRVDALALAVVLSSGEETILGISDSELCAEALRHYARSKQSRRISAFQPVALALAVAVLAFAFERVEPFVRDANGGSRIVSVSQIGVMDFSGVPAEHFERLVRRHARPVKYTAPRELDAQTFATAYIPKDG